MEELGLATLDDYLHNTALYGEYGIAVETRKHSRVLATRMREKK
jgi:hypothetical protein